MVVFDKTIEIEAPPERVFHYLMQVWRAPRWHPGLVRATPDDGGPLRAGSTFHAVEQAAGMRLERASEATAIDACTRFAWRSLTGDFTRHEGSYSLEPTARGTRLRLRMQIELPFILPRVVTEAELRRALSQREDVALWRLKDLLEGRKVEGGALQPTGLPLA